MLCFFIYNYYKLSENLRQLYYIIGKISSRKFTDLNQHPPFPITLIVFFYNIDFNNVICHLNWPPLKSRSNKTRKKK